jgi:integrase
LGALVLWKNFWPHYIEKVSKVRHREKTTELYDLCCRKLAEFLGDVDLMKITAEIVDSYVAFRKKQNVSNRTINIEISVLRRALLAAIRWGWLRKMPFQSLDLLPEGPLRVRFLDPSSRQRLLAASGKHLDLIVFFLSSGLRRGELRHLRWQDVDLSRGAIVIRDSKSGRSRTVPLSPTGVDILRRRSRLRHISCDNVFWNPATGKEWKDLSHVIKKVLRRAGLNDWRLHDLRHSFATHLHELGAELPDLMEILGHKTAEMSKRYIHPSQHRLGGLLQRMDDDLSKWSQLELSEKS